MKDSVRVAGGFVLALLALALPNDGVMPPAHAQPAEAPRSAVERRNATPLNVGVQKQLFIDERFIESKAGVQIIVNRPTVTGEKLLVSEHPWEDFFIGAYVSVVQDEDRIHMWYETADQRELNKLTAVAYAYSTDGGATWIKPKLGVVEYEGSRDNNLVLTKVHGNTVFLNRPDAPPEKRFCMFVGQSEASGEHKHPNRAFYSPDGIHWTQTGSVPFFNIEELLAKHHHFHLDSQNVMFWDTRLNQFVAMVRINSGPKASNYGRTVGRAVSSTFGDFPTPEIVFHRDEQDPPNLDFYTSGTIQYPYAADAYFMFPAAYHKYPKEKGNDGPIDIQFAASRDGITWLRPDRRPVIRTGRDGAWNSGTHYVGYGLSRHGDELSIYYTAHDVTHGAYKERGYLRGSIARAIYRLDGFMSADAGYEGGEFSTPPLTFSGDRLEINFDGSAGGWARVEVQDGEGRPIPGFTEVEADRVEGNAVAKGVTWGGKGDVSSLRGKPVKLRFLMRDVKLYAFQFPTSP